MQIPVDIPIIIVPLLGITALWFMSTWGVAFAANQRAAHSWPVVRPRPGCLCLVGYMAHG